MTEATERVFVLPGGVASELREKLGFDSNNCAAWEGLVYDACFFASDRTTPAERWVGVLIPLFRDVRAAVERDGLIEAIWSLWLISSDGNRGHEAREVWRFLCERYPALCVRDETEE